MGASLFEYQPARIYGVTTAAGHRLHDFSRYFNRRRVGFPKPNLNPGLDVRYVQSILVSSQAI